MCNFNWDVHSVEISVHSVCVLPDGWWLLWLPLKGNDRASPEGSISQDRQSCCQFWVFVSCFWVFDSTLWALRGWSRQNSSTCISSGWNASSWCRRARATRGWLMITSCCLTSSAKCFTWTHCKGDSSQLTWIYVMSLCEPRVSLQPKIAKRLCVLDWTLLY